MIVSKGIVCQTVTKNAYNATIRGLFSSYKVEFLF